MTREKLRAGFGGLVNLPFRELSQYGCFLSERRRQQGLYMLREGQNQSYMDGVGAAGPHKRPPNMPFEMICDKPFVFILCEYTFDGGDQILFTGIVNKP